MFYQKIYEAVMSAENNDQEAMFLEIQQLRRELQRAMKANELRNEETSFQQMVEPLLQELEEAEEKQSAERLQLAAELKEAKHELEDLRQQLHAEKVLRKQTETEKLEAVEIAEALFRQVEEMQRLSEERSAESRELSARLRSEEEKQEELRQEVLELRRTLHEEKEARNQAEAVNLTRYETDEAFCKEVERQLQKERERRAEAERSNMEAVQVGEALFQKLEEARTVAEKLSDESQTLADKLQTEKLKQEALNQEITELIQTLDKETLLRIQAENYELEAVEVLELLQQRRRRKSSAGTRRFCSNRRNFSRRFRTGATRRATNQLSVPSSSL